MTQQTLDGEDANAPIRFDCPFCGKHIELKVEKGRVYHRPWVFHLTGDHGDALRCRSPSACPTCGYIATRETANPYERYCPRCHSFFDIRPGGIA